MLDTQFGHLMPQENNTVRKFLSTGTAGTGTALLRTAQALGMCNPGFPKQLP